jgi:hypothetical protein
MSYRAAIAQKIRTVVDKFNFVLEIGAAHEESFLITSQELFIATDDSLTVHGDLERSRSCSTVATVATVATVEAISQWICYYKGVRSSDNAKPMDGGAKWDIVASAGLSSDQRTSAVAERPACVIGKLTMDNFDDNLDSWQQKLMEEWEGNFYANDMHDSRLLFSKCLTVLQPLKGSEQS